VAVLTLKGIVVLGKFWIYQQLSVRLSARASRTQACPAIIVWIALNFCASFLAVGPRINPRVQDGEAGFALPVLCGVEAKKYLSVSLLVFSSRFNSLK
jgi:hypothetical protein